MPRMLLVFLVLMASCMPAARGADAKDDTLDGIWVPASAELGGQPLPEEVRKSIKLMITGAKYSVTVGPNVDKGTFKVLPNTSPKAMDITSTEGASKGKTFLAIFEQKGDTLRVCYELGSQKRPTEFKTKPDTMLFLVEYKRQK